MEVNFTNKRTALAVLFCYFPMFYHGDKPKSDSSQHINRYKNIDIGIPIFRCYICATFFCVIQYLIYHAMPVSAEVNGDHRESSRIANLPVRKVWTNV